MNINAKTRITGLLGYPVEHSLSPEMHNSAFGHLGLNYCYIALPVRPESLGMAIEGIRAMNFTGVNITVPHKEKVPPLLDDIDREADFIGAVNTIVNEEGKLKGYNTDGRGFIKSLDENKITYDDSSIFVIGAGGASRAVCYYLSRKASNLRIFDIDISKAESLVNDLKTINSNVSFDSDRKKIEMSDIVINATPLGLKADDPLPFDTEGLSEGQVVVDLIYRDTPLLKSARQKKCETINGLGMLLWQGALAFELWTGTAAPVDIMKKALLNGFSKRQA
ncbi:MAG TPA: shikimate dehydrogenase [Nitrospirae bacterium]|nr:shikimate dehydrogenase [Nitrospirota bacterium]